MLKLRGVTSLCSSRISLRTCYACRYSSTDSTSEDDKSKSEAVETTSETPKSGAVDKEIEGLLKFFQRASSKVADDAEKTPEISKAQQKSVVDRIGRRIAPSASKFPTRKPFFLHPWKYLWASEPIRRPDDPPPKDKVSFDTLLRRHSGQVAAGNPAGTVLLGYIFEVVGDDLYVDFGGKFHCVVQKPKYDRHGQWYVRGAFVEVMVEELEHCRRFLGTEQPVSLHEANGVLLGPSQINFPRTRSELGGLYLKRF